MNTKEYYNDREVFFYPTFHEETRELEQLSENDQRICEYINELFEKFARKENG